jgi:hypothetical protein
VTGPLRGQKEKENKRSAGPIWWKKVSKRCENFIASLYVDDAAVFIKPTTQDLQVIESILKIFSEVSGLTINMDKTQFFLIRCDSADLTFLSQQNHPISHFPCSYLGLPLHTKKLPRNAFMKLIQKIVDRLQGWKRGFLTYPGKELLVKSVLSAMPSYFITMFKMPKWGLNKIDKYRRGFLWKGHDAESTTRGHCLVNWKTCIRPKKLGGLGIKDLEKFGRAQVEMVMTPLGSQGQAMETHPKDHSHY